ncbi:ZIP family metal transporter [Rhodovibrio salinarum]|uniref:Divalent cation transporter n=1 Tax=Rhodovibrio salinarum TaxID=1087 RepID=A0A934V0G2_9PROT|nr:divalent cation transporter [Rhodovibrio salinarum]MBK1698172.1 divalent cation transporter [Rhodovibrio salinarum]
MTNLEQALLFATIAGAAMPLGALAAVRERLQSDWLEAEFRHSVIAFGGGVLLAAIALVLVPEGVRDLPPWACLAAFAAGGIIAFIADRAIERRGGAAAQLMAMLLDFVPEALAMGAMLAQRSQAGVLLALLIGLQNLPEGFNAYRELQATRRHNPAMLIAAFVLLVPLGPAAAWIGMTVLEAHPYALSMIMLFAAGGILYLTFQDIAPQVRLDRHWAPPLGAVGGFLLGLAGSFIVA